MPKIDPFKTPDGKPISNAIDKLNDLSDRDFVVASCAIVDSNLTHVLQGRLADLPKIAENFLGLGNSMDGGGASNLSSKAELAALVGLIGADEVRYLKAFMRIRNHFAHRVVIDFTAEEVVNELRKLTAFVEGIIMQLKNDPHPTLMQIYRTAVDEGTCQIGKTNQAGRNVLAIVRVGFEALFSRIDSENRRVTTRKPIIPEESVQMNANEHRAATLALINDALAKVQKLMLFLKEEALIAYREMNETKADNPMRQ